MKTIKIFGYGSLINLNSLKETCPESKFLFTANLKGFIRIFNTKSTTRFNKDNTSVCVLNIDKSEYNPMLNGICFEIKINDFEELKKRESAYELVQVEIEEYDNPNNIHKAYVWRAKHFETYDFQFDSKVQQEYLDLCLEGCKNFNKNFLSDFKETTFIGDKTLKELGM